MWKNLWIDHTKLHLKTWAYSNKNIRHLDIKSQAKNHRKHVINVKSWFELNHIQALLKNDLNSYLLICSLYWHILGTDILIKGCVPYIFASLFFMAKREHLWNKEECFLFHLESSFHSWDNQISTLQIFKCYDVMKCPSMKHKTHFTEKLVK